MVNRLENIGSLLLFFSGINLLLASFFIVINQSIEGYILIVSLLLSVVFLYFITDKGSKEIKDIAINFIIFMLIILGAIKLSIMYYDFSFDGQAYHQEALIQMKEGWNPLYETLTTTDQDIWINHYAKGIWYLGVVVYDFTGKIESAKAFNIILLISTLLILLGYIQKKINNWKLTIPISILMVLSPVVINQLFTNYNDFFIGLLIINLIVGYLNFIETSSRKVLINIFISIILLVNIKFTALGYALVLTGIPLFMYVLDNYVFKNNKFEWRSKGKLLATTIVLSFIVAVFFVGSSSYVKNTLTNGHPFYPLAGEGKVDIITSNTPTGLRDLNRLEKLYVSIFSETNNEFDTEPKTKFPLSITKEEVAYAAGIDTRIGGFGPLFGFIILMTLCLALVNYRKIDKRDVWPFGIVMSVIILSILINPETWWARYVPQLWLIPFLFVLLIMKNKIKSYVMYIILLAYSLNIIIIGYESMKSLSDRQSIIEEQLITLKEYSADQPLLIELGVFKANRARLIENGIEFNEVDSIEGCQNVVQLVYSSTKACLDKQHN